ncbi:DUF397 domain-containing protein [Nocardia crassostreae]|uniref:DUF397 domain-containing protein n=1 Tax=Nocardia crassostreae TaxID=53428 RepID=UPI0009FF5464|nr:DUF397 domain-containing protein [Nocardia crassostreae]
MNDELFGARWFKSSYSGASQECVEVAHLSNGMVGVRDSKNPNGGVLILAPEVWDAFTASELCAEH